MNRIIVSKIFESFQDLEKAIKIARDRLDQFERPDENIVSRLDQYEEILKKQKALATALIGYVTLDNWDEVVRHIKLINGLSVMIRDDAKGLMTVSPMTEGNHLPQESFI